MYSKHTADYITYYICLSDLNFISININIYNMRNLGNIYLTEHFSLNELCDSHRGNELHISNVPEWDILICLNRLACRLEAVRTYVRLPIIVNSGYRCPLINHEVGGVVNSKHTQGLAADIRCENMDLLRKALKYFTWEEYIDHDNYIHVAL